MKIDRKPADPQPDHRRQRDRPLLDDRLEKQAEAPDRSPEEGGGDPDRDRPEELGAVGASEGRNVWDRQSERPEAGPGVQADEDERPHPGAQETWDENDAQHRAAEPGGLHQEERSDEGRAEERADRREASCRPDHGNRLRRRVLLEQVNGEDAEPAADRDQRRLGPEHDPEAEGRQ